mmetsp:Transcript_6448/g.27141  ORF Transcript_6448/g.27141 Transcript_6448/m.27141 type:complete len:205 (+) Transcript_6448:97-711(+)
MRGSAPNGRRGDGDGSDEASSSSSDAPESSDDDGSSEAAVSSSAAGGSMGGVTSAAVGGGVLLFRRRGVAKALSALISSANTKSSSSSSSSRPDGGGGAPTRRCRSSSRKKRPRSGVLPATWYSSETSRSPRGRRPLLGTRAHDDAPLFRTPSGPLVASQSLTSESTPAVASAVGRAGCGAIELTTFRSARNRASGAPSDARHT